MMFIHTLTYHGRISSIYCIYQSGPRVTQHHHSYRTYGLHLANLSLDMVADNKSKILQSITILSGDLMTNLKIYIYLYIAYIHPLMFFMYDCRPPVTDNNTFDTDLVRFYHIAGIFNRRGDQSQSSK